MPILIHLDLHLDQERIAERELSKIKPTPKNVYRVIQCQETELTQMMSTMSDGWKFEQVGVSLSRISSVSAFMG